MKKTLVLVDIQNDFLPTGNLPVPDGDKILPVVNGITRSFDLIVATQDWHPADHKSFASMNPGSNPGDMIKLRGIDQVLWPDHCVQGSTGAMLVDDLEKEKIQKIFKKGLNPEVDSYSGFFENDHQTSTGLDKFLKDQNATDIYIAGLALDYCVKYTALDCVELGFKTTVIVNGTRAVNMAPNDGANAIEEMKKAGINIIESAEL